MLTLVVGIVYYLEKKLVLVFSWFLGVWQGIVCFLKEKVFLLGELYCSGFNLVLPLLVSGIAYFEKKLTLELSTLGVAGGAPNLCLAV